MNEHLKQAKGWMQHVQISVEKEPASKPELVGLLTLLSIAESLDSIAAAIDCSYGGRVDNKENDDV